MDLTRAQRAGWGLADLGIVVFNIVKQLLVFAFLTTQLGVPVGTAGAVTSAVLFFDILTDPIVGWLSDRTQSRFGRRGPWIVLGAPVMVLGMWLLFSVEPGPGAALRVGAAFALASVGFTMVAVPYGAMAGEMTRDPRTRSAMTAWRMAFAALGILVGGAVVPALAGKLGDAGAILAAAPLILGAIWASQWLTRRAPRVDRATGLGIRAQMGLVLRDRAFLRLVALYGLMTLAVAVMTAGMAFVALYLVAPEPSSLSGAAAALGTLSVFFAAFTLGALVAQPLWAALSGALGHLRALSIGLAGYVALLLALWLALPAGLTVLAALFVLGGLFNGAYQQIPWALYPDHMDGTRDEGGEALEGGYSALWLMGQKVANAFGPLLLGQLLARAGWAEATGGTFVAQRAEALAMLRGAVTILPAGLLVLALFGLWIAYAPAVRRAGLR